MDSSQAPLIAGHSDEEEELEYATEESGTPLEAGKTGSGMPSAFVLALTFAAGISGLLFGCAYPSLCLIAKVMLTDNSR
jgi:SP family myo-inositol transporter-like MFS transporter 13